MTTTGEILEEAAATFRQRNAEYGENYLVVGRVMHALFPDGLTITGEAEWNKFHLWMLAVVKLTRYTQNYEDGHEDSLMDDIVYKAMVLKLDREAKPVPARPSEGHPGEVVFPSGRKLKKKEGAW